MKKIGIVIPCYNEEENIVQIVSAVKNELEKYSNRYDYEMNQLFYFAKNNIDVKYIDMETIYEKGNPTSHFNALKDSYLVHKEFFIILILIIITLIIVII